MISNEVDQSVSSADEEEQEPEPKKAKPSVKRNLTGATINEAHTSDTINVPHINATKKVSQTTSDSVHVTTFFY